MTAFDRLPQAEQAALLQELRDVYDEFEGVVRRLSPPTHPCGTCSRCCVGPPLYMSLSEVEFAYAYQYAKEQGGAPAVHFETTWPDLRHAYSTWACPFHSPTDGCTVYPNRPLACRAFGPYSRHYIQFENCGYQETSLFFREPNEIPTYKRFLALLARYPSNRGYVYPDSIAFPKPTVELLMGLTIPGTPLANIRIPIAGDPTGS